MTEQEIFDKVCEHLSEQKRRAMNFDGISCAYLTEGGLKCAVGCLFTEGELETYGKSNFGILNLMRGESPVPSLEGVDLLFLTLLQHIHDNTEEGPKQLRDKLKGLSLRRDLDSSKIDLIQEWNN